jgi:hypothetical protein
MTMKIATAQARSRLLLCALASCLATTVAAEQEAFSAYRKAESLYRSALATDDCGQIEQARVVLQGLSRSREAIPQSVADELQTGRAWLGDYARVAKRDLNGRWAELCRTPVADCKPPPPVALETLDATYALAELTPDCGVTVSIAERLIGMSDAASASHTLRLLSQLWRARPECFP